MLSNEFSAAAKTQNGGITIKYHLFRSEQTLSYREVLTLWESGGQFLEFFLGLLKQCGFNSYVWETPSISAKTLDRDFEFVIINSPTLPSVPDRHTFKDYFEPEGPDNGVVAFPNLGHDAWLIVPSPATTDADYSGLAQFLRQAPITQQLTLWQVLARQIKLMLSTRELWISVAGGGVAWLHVRIDERPKYYRHRPYTGSGL